MRRERGLSGINHAVLARPIGDGVEIDFDQRARKLAAVGKQHRLADERAGLEKIFDLARAMFLPPGGTLMSFLRWPMRKCPLGINSATSPVWSQPSRTTSLVASSFFQ